MSSCWVIWSLENIPKSQQKYKTAVVSVSFAFLSKQMSDTRHAIFEIKSYIRTNNIYTKIKRLIFQTIIRSLRQFYINIRDKQAKIFLCDYIAKNIILQEQSCEIYISTFENCNHEIRTKLSQIETHFEQYLNWY